MVFSSLLFIYYFLPVTFFAYYIIKDKFRNFVFLAAGMFFYAWGEPVYILLMLFSVTANYFLGRMIYTADKNKKAVLFAGCSFNVLLLGVFKYSVFIAENLSRLPKISVHAPHLPLPLGISFFTFEAMSYLIDVYRKDTEPQRNFWEWAVYIVAFPCLTAGPIIRYPSIRDQLHGRVYTLDGISRGITRFTLGLSKKILIANALGQIADTAFKHPDSRMSALTAWIAMAAYTLQIYFDFSGYSDMAIGLGKMFGFSYDENFRYPYISTAVSEFWRRWHISLGSWFRDYIYIPLGGNRKGTGKTIRNLLVVWLLTGLWHGASWNYVIWGLYYGVFIIMEKLIGKKMEKIPKCVSHIYLILVVMIGWVFFRTENLTQAFHFLENLFCLSGGEATDAPGRLLLHDNFLLLSFAAVGSTPVISNIGRALIKNEPDAEKSLLAYIVVSAAVCVLLLISTVYLANSTYSPFIYFRF